MRCFVWFCVVVACGPTAVRHSSFLCSLVAENQLIDRLQSTSTVEYSKKKQGMQIMMRWKPEHSDGLLGITVNPLILNQ